MSTNRTHADHTVLITGANAGLGFDSARQLAAAGWGRVFIGARSQAKADGAIARLVEATGRPAGDFGSAIFDNNKPDTVRSAVATLAKAGQTFDALVLNAGGMAHMDGTGKPALTADGLSTMYTMNVHGHVLFVDGLLDAGLLSEGATVMFAGSEASRGIPAMRMATPTLPQGLGDLDATLEAVVRADHAGQKGYNDMVDYGFAKLIGTVWMRVLSQRHGLRALTVSPGFTGGTEAMEKLPAIQKFMFLYVALPIMKLLGNAHELEYGAKRYVQALEDEAIQAGGYYASPGKGISGDLTLQDPALQPLLLDPAFEAAVTRLIDRQLGKPAGLRAVV
jgi:NAD(P)-dependent dehydrogenase (short-subunit alcohol dehydrogenase family)